MLFGIHMGQSQQPADGVRIDSRHLPMPLQQCRYVAIFSAIYYHRRGIRVRSWTGRRYGTRTVSLKLWINGIRVDRGWIRTSLRVFKPLGRLVSHDSVD